MARVSRGVVTKAKHKKIFKKAKGLTKNPRIHRSANYNRAGGTNGRKT